MKRFTGLLREDLKRKLGMIAAAWYSMGMLCLVFSMKTTVPTGEVRSLYVGPGNTSFFAVMVLFGILMGAGAFRFLRSEPETDLYFGLPFTRPQLFMAGWVNNLLIFAVPLMVCRLLFFQISLAMGYSRYEESILSVRMGCLVPILGFLFMMGLSMLAYLLAQNTGCRIGLLALFLLGPDAGIRLIEKLLGMMVPSFYRSEVLEMMKEYLSPLSLLLRSTGVQEYADGSYFDKYVTKDWGPQSDVVKGLFEGIFIPGIEDWKKLKENVMQDGLYNQYRLAVAPNGSTSYINDSTASLHPIINRVEERQEKMIGKIYYPAPYLSNDTMPYYRSAYDMDMRKVIDTYAAAQQHIDQSLSMTLFMRSTIPAGLYEWKNGRTDKMTTRDLNILRHYAYKRGIKSIYYIRTFTDDSDEIGANQCVVGHVAWLMW